MKAILLLSGGIDSPVAAHLMQKKGFELVAVHFYNKHIGDIDTMGKCKELCGILGIDKLHTIPFDEQQAEVVRKCEHKYYYIITRRLMWRVAEKIAERERAGYLITGENLGQVASQTISNMAVTNAVVKIPVLRPILCNDKNETIKIAREIGTYEISSGPEVCCLFGPKHPATHSTIESIEDEEKKIDVARLVDKAIQSAEVKTIDLINAA